MVAALLTAAWIALQPDHFSPTYVGFSILLLVGLLIHYIRNREDSFTRLLLEYVSVFGIVAFVDILLGGWESRCPSFPIYSQFSSACLNLIGIDAAVSGSLLCIQTPDGLVRLIPSIEKTGLRWTILFLVAWWAFGFRNSRGWKSFGVVLGVLFFSLFRFAICVGVYLEFDQLLGPTGKTALGVFHSKVSVLLYLVLVGAVVDIIMNKIGEPTRNFSSPSPRARIALFPLLIFLTTATSVFAMMITLPGERKGGRILVDDRLGGQWEPTARILDKEWYGDFSTYSFSSLVEWLGHFYSVDVNTSVQYDSGILNSYDVLVIKTPENPLSDLEISSIQNWIEDGGGLMLIGDHTNLLGMSTRMNQLVEKYGMRFRYDAVSTGYVGGFNLYRKPFFGSHPSSRNVNRLLFLTSCSLDVDWWSEPSMVMGDCSKSPHDYSGGSFFSPSSRCFPDQEYGRCVVAAQRRAGKGRIAMFTDSTVLSSFAVFMNDNREILLGQIDDLNRRRNIFQTPIRIVGIACCVLVLIGIYVFVDRANPVPTIFLCTLGLWTGVAAVEVSQSLMFHRPRPHCPIIDVAFVHKGTRSAFPPTLGGLGGLPAEYAFDTLFVATQRVGLVPRYVADFDETFRENTEAVVLISPVQLPPDEWLRKARRYIQEGGNLLILDEVSTTDPTNGVALANELGWKITSSVNERGGLEIRFPPGSTQLNYTPRMFGGVFELGKGKLCYLVDASEFSRENLGHCFDVPKKSAQNVYATIFDLFENVFGLNAGDRRYYGILEE